MLIYYKLLNLFIFQMQILGLCKNDANTSLRFAGIVKILLLRLYSCKIFRLYKQDDEAKRHNSYRLADPGGRKVV